MNHPRFGKVYLTERDAELIDYLFLNKIATSEQIARDVFGSPNLNLVRKRLKKLIGGKHLARTVIERGVPMYAYHLTQKTFNHFIQKRIDKDWGQLKSEAPLHDVILVDIRRRFLESHKVDCFITENAMEAGFDYPYRFPVGAFQIHHSDGAIVFKNNGKCFNVAIEYENSPQSSRKYGEKIYSYYNNHEVNGTIFIAKDQSIYNRLRKIDMKFCKNRKSKCFFGMLSDVLNPQWVQEFPNNTGEILSLE